MKAANHETCGLAVDYVGGVWECSGYGRVYCVHQELDRNPDGSVNIIKCEDPWAEHNSPLLRGNEARWQKKNGGKKGEPKE